MSDKISIYMPDQIASVYFDNRRDLHVPPPKKNLLSRYFGWLNDNTPQPQSIASADEYLKSLGFHEDQVKVFRSHVDKAILDYLKSVAPKKGVLCDFNENHYLGLRPDRMCFSNDPASVGEMRGSFVSSLNAAKPQNYKLFWTNVQDFVCHPAPQAKMEVA